MKRTNDASQMGDLRVGSVRFFKFPYNFMLLLERLRLNRFMESYPYSQSRQQASQHSFDKHWQIILPVPLKFLDLLNFIFRIALIWHGLLPG
jgi:hypothetical protein